MGASDPPGRRRAAGRRDELAAQRHRSQPPLIGDWLDAARERERALDSLRLRRVSIAQTGQRLVDARASGHRPRIGEVKDQLRRLERLRAVDIVDAVMGMGCPLDDVAEASGLSSSAVAELVVANTIPGQRRPAS